VYVNGALLDTADITATDGTTITFTSALALNDEVRILSYKAIGSVAIGDISGLQTALDAKVALTGDQTVAGIKTFSSAISAPNTFGFKNRIINGDMRIDQRNAGASITPSANGTMCLDRWKCGLNTGVSPSKYSVQQSSTAPVGFSNSVLITSTSAYTVQADDYATFSQAIEGFNFADFGFGTANAQSLTISFQIRCSLTGTFAGWIQNDAANRSYPFTFTISAANTWESKSITIAGDTTGTWVGATSSTGLLMGFNLGVGSTRQGTANTWGAGNYRTVSGAVNLIATNAATMNITGVQLEKGSTATSFDVRPYGTELALCQRYYYRITSTGDNCFGSGWAASGTQGTVMIPYPVTMRTKPTALEQSGTAANYRIIYSGTATACNSVPTFSPITSEINAGVNFFVASGLTTGIGLGAQVTPSTTAYLGWSAEL
jgi:hypothetical protein